ncbi:hypothetical protein [Kangiella marina]|uniref:Lipoprotein n=1 Tax=Kangiella marina TaxID=1079178 RepID=A0ABP8IFX0_9GAMM
MRQNKYHIGRKVIFILISLVLTSCGLQEKEREIIKIKGFNIIQEDRTINFILPEHCLSSYKEWFGQMNDKGYKLNTNIYKIDHFAPFGNIKYTAMINSNYFSNSTLWTKVNNYLTKSCYGDTYDEIDAVQLFNKDQDLFTIYQLDVPLTNIRLRNKTIEVYYDSEVLSEYIKTKRQK